MSLPTRDKIHKKYEAALDRIRTIHIKPFPGYDDPLFLISNAYPGVWMEHVYDAIAWYLFSGTDKQVMRGQVKLFLDHQKEDGQLPCYVLDRSNPNFNKGYRTAIGYSQLQECVSFTKLCMEAALLLEDDQLMAEAYEKCVRWDEWLVRNRMVTRRGLIELFCLYDTGHDKSQRFAGIPGGCPEGNAANMNDLPDLPLLAPDMNAVFYGSRMALAQMAMHLGKKAESEAWHKKAQEVRDALIEHCYNEEDAFFYDVDCHGKQRKIRSIAIASLFMERVIEGEMAETIYQRHLKNPEEFWTPYPFPAMAVNDPASVYTPDGNSWSFFSQALTALRAFRWMDHYGKGEDFDHVLKCWVCALTDAETPFTQEIHPLTGEMTKVSQWYSSAMLLYLHAVKRLKLLEEN